MGRRDKERVKKIQAGELLSIRDQHDRLMFQSVRQAQAALFERYYQDSTEPYEERDQTPLTDEERQRLGTELQNEAATALVGGLPAALDTLRRSEFSEKELKSSKGWKTLLGAGINGVLASDRGVFGMAGKDVWKLRTRRGGRLRGGTWGYCLWCGSPLYRTASAQRKWCQRLCYLKSKKWERLAR